MMYSSPFKTKLIYVYSMDYKTHKGALKIGETTINHPDFTSLKPNCKALNDAANKRIEQITQTSGIGYKLLYTEVAIYSTKGANHHFSDKDVHNVLKRSGVKKKEFNTNKQPSEWFVTELETVKEAIKAVKEGKSAIWVAKKSNILAEHNPVEFRPEQLEAVSKAVKLFQKGNTALWYAKMRFGKTLCALQVVKEMAFKRTLILTHRPDVKDGWFKDFDKIFFEKNTSYQFGSKQKGHNIEELEAGVKKIKSSYVYFASMQDLRGSNLVGGNFDKNHKLLSISWDCIIVDEAHEGTTTELGKNVMKVLTKKNTKVLKLSGTPFNLLADHTEDEIFTWDYVMEQRAKKDWDTLYFDQPNPYSGLARLNIFTYDLGYILKTRYDDEDDAFNFREFFRVKEKGKAETEYKFEHEKDVKNFLDLICKRDKESNYPYSTEEYRDFFRHSLWMVPGVKEANALSALLRKHSVFQHFNIANVAGEGDKEEKSSTALQKVKKAITDKPHEAYSITISCGRLTTGVSIPEWTAVFMLAGSSNTSASAYMQTIFRVQTPAVINGKIKEECYVFDFAPDRTLKVIAEAAKISAKAGKTSSDDRQIMGEFLNFCPIIAYDGSKMKPYNVNGMLEQLKKVYIERVVRNGFEDGYLYNNDQLMNLNAVERKDFDGLKKVIGTTPAQPKTNDIPINAQGYNEEEYEKSQSSKSAKKVLTEQEKKRLKALEEKRKLRDTAISILRGISIRMPLMIYGADINDEKEEITIDNFSQLIDPKSWDEFMPKGVTKQIFNNFKKYYDPDIFRAAGKRIRNMARAADNFDIEDRIKRITDIFGTFRNPDKETVLTPWRVVNMHLGDCLGGWVFYDEQHEKPISNPRFVHQGTVTHDVFAEDSCILEINSKSGLYPLFMAYNIYRTRLKTQNIESDNLFGSISVAEQHEIWDSVVAENIFVICKTPMAQSITKRTLVGFRKAKVNARYVEDLIDTISNNPALFLKKIAQGKTFWKSNNNNNMKFNAIVGNPPYQVNVGVTKENYGVLIFGKFVEIAKQASPRFISMIIPSRWFTGGRGLEEFRANMLNDDSLCYIKDFVDSRDCFPGVDIAGGISYFLWDKEYSGKCTFDSVRNGKITTAERVLNEFEVFPRYNDAITIINKVKLLNEQTLHSQIGPQTPFGFVTTFRGKPESFPNAITLYSSGGISYVAPSEINKNVGWINKYKVIFSKATSEHAGTPDKNGMFRIFSKIEILNPNEICTQSYLVGGVFENRFMAAYYIKYLKTRFVRILVLPTLTTQDLSKDKFKFVPLQDFTMFSDIDWSQDIDGIDRQLYKKYKFTEDEIAFIESMIKPME